MTTSPEIILVNEQDQAIGSAEKLYVHQKGLLHRAFSVLVFNDKKELLIHQRTLEKYHSGGLWTNTCCGHPNVGEDILVAAHRRLEEEMGFQTELEFIYKFSYKTTFNNGLIENEIDHVFVGNYNGLFTPNNNEVADYKWLTLDGIINAVILEPDAFTYWFKEILKSNTFLTYAKNQGLLML